MYSLVSCSKFSFNSLIRYDSNVEWTYQRPVYYDELKFNKYLKECSTDNNIEEELKKCDFKKRLFLCNIIDESLSIENVNKTSRFYFAIEDWELLSNLSHYYIFIINQIVSLFCLFSNLIFILVISNRNLSKEFQKHINSSKIYIILNCI